MKNFLIVATLILSATFGGNAKAGLITVSIDQDNVSVGDMIELTLNATGFDEFDTFGINVDFDTSLFSFLPATFTSDLPTFGMLWNQVGNGVAIGFVDLFPASGDFLLGKFNLIALENGATNFSLVVNEFTLSDPFDPFAVATPVNADTSRAAFASVPEPGTLSIMFIALVSLVSLKKKRQKMGS
jgi:hypothetical protein